MRFVIGLMAVLVGVATIAVNTVLRDTIDRWEAEREGYQKWEDLGRPADVCMILEPGDQYGDLMPCDQIP